MEKPSKKRCLITVTDNISSTSMPYNEFVLYRKKHYPTERQILILLFKTDINSSVNIPSGIECHIIGTDKKKLNQVVNDIVKECKEENVEYVFHIHEGKSVVFFNLATLFRYRKKIVYTLHSTYKNYPIHNKVFAFTASFLCHYVVSVSNTAYKKYPAIIKCLRGDKITIVRNGVDLDRIGPAEMHTVNDTFTIIYVSRLVPLKRHWLLFNVIKQLPSVKLILIGKGRLEEELKAMTKDMGIDSQVVFMGLQPRNVVYEQLKRSDLFVSTSSYEGLPIGVLEAMASGTPCIVSDIEQHEEIAKECPTLQLCSDEVNMWVQKIRCIMKLSKSDVSILRRKNRDSVEKNFSLATMHESYDKLFFM